MLTETDDFEVLGPWSTVQVYRSCDCHFYYPRATVREQGYAYNPSKRVMRHSNRSSYLNTVGEEVFISHVRTEQTPSEASAERRG
jgi:hypothetical protein